MLSSFRSMMSPPGLYVPKCRARAGRGAGGAYAPAWNLRHGHAMNRSCWRRLATIALSAAAWGACGGDAKPTAGDTGRAVEPLDGSIAPPDASLPGVPGDTALAPAVDT